MNREKAMYKNVVSFTMIGLELIISSSIEALLVVKLDSNWLKTNIELH